jgi:hypothetical protein
LRRPTDAAEPPPPSDFYTLPPCRVLDTRTGEGALRSGERRPYRLAGTCGIPPTARAAVVNLTVVQPTGSGSVTLWPGDRPLPLTSSLNFGTGSVRANHAVLPLGQGGTVLAQPFVAGAGAAHLVIDVSGFFE